MEGKASLPILFFIMGDQIIVRMTVPFLRVSI